jgi:hypothetical protein
MSHVHHQSKGPDPAQVAGSGASMSVLPKTQCVPNNVPYYVVEIRRFLSSKNLSFSTCSFYFNAYQNVKVQMYVDSRSLICFQ